MSASHTSPHTLAPLAKSMFVGALALAVALTLSISLLARSATEHSGVRSEDATPAFIAHSWPVPAATVRATLGLPPAQSTSDRLTASAEHAPQD